MNKWMKKLVLIAAFAGVGGIAYAGKKSSYPVVVNVAGKTASGALGTARNDASTISYIGCHFDFFYGGCTAVSAAGLAGNCGTGNAAMIDVMRSLTPDSHVSFSWDTGGNCTNVVASKYSYHEPKQP